MATAVRSRNWFAIWVTAAVVVTLIIVTVLVVWLNNTRSGPGDTPQGSKVNTETGAIAFGTGENQVDTYIDFICPNCNQFEQAEGETIEGLVKDGTITLNVHPIAILDRSSQGTEYSSRSASAMYAVATRDPDNAYAFMQAMYQNQPAEGSEGLTDEQIIDVAKGAGVDMTSELEKDITSGKYKKFVQDMTPKTPAGPRGIGTPTLVINGQYISVTGDPQIDIVGNLK